MTTNYTGTLAQQQASDIADRKTALRLAVTDSEMLAQWHDALAPDAIHAAYVAVRDAVEAADDAIAMVGGEQKQAEAGAAERAAAHRAFVAGTGPKPKGVFKQADWYAAELDALMHCRALLGAAKKARKAYDDLANDDALMNAWRDNAIAAYEGTRDAAREAIDAAHRAYSAYVSTASRVGSLTGLLLWGQDARYLRPQLDSYDQRIADNGAGAWEALDRLLEVSDPVFTGAWAVGDLEEINRTYGPKD